MGTVNLELVVHTLERHSSVDCIASNRPLSQINTGGLNARFLMVAQVINLGLQIDTRSGTSLEVWQAVHAFCAVATRQFVLNSLHAEGL